MSESAGRLVSFGNAVLLGRNDGDAAAKAAVSRGIARWQFDTLLPRPHGIAPVRTVARSPFAWFRWLRAQGYRRLTLLLMTAAEYAALDGPLKLFTTTERGRKIVADHERDLPMLWNTWRPAAAELPMLAPSTHPIVARRLMAAVILVHRAADAYREWRIGETPRPEAFWPTLSAASIAAVNTLA